MSDAGMNDLRPTPSTTYDSDLAANDASYEATRGGTVSYEARVYETSATEPLPGDAAARGVSDEDPVAHEQHVMATYVSDMLALERHITQPLHRQLRMEDTPRYPAAQTLIAQAANYADAHVTALEQALTQLGGHEDAAVKSGWAQFVGWFAAAVDTVRKTKVSKSLRDDYTALNLAAVSYTMLHATSVALGETQVAALAREHLADYARTVMAINQAIPEVVLMELQDDGTPVAVGTAERVRTETNGIWRDESDVAR